MTFGKLQIGNIVYRCNFKKNEIIKYEVIGIDDSRFLNQIQLSLHNLSNTSAYYSYNSDYVTDIINVFSDKSYEYYRQLIDHNKDTIWCADKNTLKKIFEEYKNNINIQLNKQREYIDRL